MACVFRHHLPLGFSPLLLPTRGAIPGLPRQRTSFSCVMRPRAPGGRRDHGSLHLTSAPAPTSPSPYALRPPLDWRLGFSSLARRFFHPASRGGSAVATHQHWTLGAGFGVLRCAPVGRPGHHQDRSLGPGRTVILAYGLRQSALTHRPDDVCSSFGRM